jgi:hypothetical protein
MLVDEFHGRLFYCGLRRGAPFTGLSNDRFQLCGHVHEVYRKFALIFLITPRRT